MTAVDFLLCCVGCSTVLVSGAWAVRLLFGDRRGKSPSHQPAARLDDPSPIETGLVDRLRAIQTARYATPIARPRPDYTPTQGEPGGPRVVPPIRVLQPRTKPFSVPKQPTPPKKGPLSLPKPEQTNADVISFPLRMRKDDPTTKKE